MKSQATVSFRLVALRLLYAFSKELPNGNIPLVTPKVPPLHSISSHLLRLDTPFHKHRTVTLPPSTTQIPLPAHPPPPPNSNPPQIPLLKLQNPRNPTPPS